MVFLFELIIHSLFDIWVASNELTLLLLFHFHLQETVKAAADVVIMSTSPPLRPCQGSFDFVWLCPSFPHGFSESSLRSVLHRSSFTTTGAVVSEGAERSRLRYPTESLCVGALPGHIFTLLASFYTITTQRQPPSRGNVKTPSAHVWVRTGRICVERRVKRCCEAERRRIQ